MNRSEFLRSSVQLTCASCLGLMLHPRAAAADAPAPADPTSPVDEALKQAQDETAFVNHWLTDLFDTIDAELDPATRRKLMDGCGRGCFRRHKFKQDIAEAGKGDVGRLVAAYQKNFLVWREGDLIHIAYGTGKNTCFCPAARRRPARPNDLHCECTRATHQTVFETALGRPVRVELVETVRRGGNRCHLVADVR